MSIYMIRVLMTLYLKKIHASLMFYTQLWWCHGSLRPSDAYRRHQSRPSLVQIMAFRLVGDKPFSEPMDIVKKTLGNEIQWNRNRNLHIFIQENAFETVVWKMSAILSRPLCVDTYMSLTSPLRTRWHLVVLVHFHVQLWETEQSNVGWIIWSCLFWKESDIYSR